MILCQAPAPTDVSAVYKGQDQGKGKDNGKVGKDNGKWKDKDKEADAKPDAEVICYCCHRKGHRERDCQTTGGRSPRRDRHPFKGPRPPRPK